MAQFTHLHVHTQYSILDGAASIPVLIKKVKDSGMNALAITDHGNMYGVLEFITNARQENIKPIIGCEIYVAEQNRFEKKGREDRSGFHLILLAKNKTGYRNLSKLTSLGFIEGFYYTPRIDKELLRTYREGLIASSACLGGELPNTILNKGEDAALKVIEEFKEIFGEDYYLELQNHNLPEQQQVNSALIRLSEKTGVKCIATNDVHYVNGEDFEAHRILICLNTGKDLETYLSGNDHMGYTGQEYLKTPEEMCALFPDYLQAIENTQEIVEKIEPYEIKQNVKLPHFPLPEGFMDENEYLRYLTYSGAEKVYSVLTDEITERIEYELTVIKNMEFPGYFLIVQDFINAAREQGVIVGPGRGSAAGSVVAYCIGITKVDPMLYNLLFERFLNPERVSMPDMDIDFDDEGREKVLKYVVEKYGEDRVAQIVTFGTMAAKMAIRDVARVLKMPLPEADRLAKLIPEKPGTTLKKAYEEVPELKELRNKGSEIIKRTLSFAETLEGCARHTGIHACGVIIGPDNLIEHIPLSTAKDASLKVTQYEGSLIESAGMLKMDFLGLKTLSIIRDALRNIKKRHDLDIDIDEIPLDDPLTFDLYQKGDTIGTFQFESPGMRNYLQELKPTSIEDLIAMNALYRPGPMEHIPVYIKRKHGREKIEYPHPLLEKILKPTFGIMVYQEQVMQVAQVLSGFTLSKADVLRSAMAKKKIKTMEEMKVGFIDGAIEKNIDKSVAEKIFADIFKFSEYAFNRSHAAAYSLIAYETAYLKAHYPAEYMAAVLTHNLNDIKKITQFIEECLRHKITVLGPDVNESDETFTVNKKGMIRFGLAAVKNVGESAVKSIITERDKKGAFTDVFDFLKRVSQQAANKRVLEALVMAGAFDCFENIHRAQYFYREREDDTVFLEKLTRFAAGIREKSGTPLNTLFDDMPEMTTANIEFPHCPPWTKFTRIKNEKEITGFYISGHPLDDYEPELKLLCNTSISEVKLELGSLKNKTITFAGLISGTTHKTDKKGSKFATFVIEDFTDSVKLSVFSEDYLKFKHFIEDDNMVLIKASVVPRKNQPDIVDVKILNFWLIDGAFQKLVNSVTLTFELSDLTNELVVSLVKIAEACKGDAPFKMIVVDKAENSSITLNPKKIRIEPGSFIRQVYKIPALRIKLNDKQ